MRIRLQTRTLTHATNKIPGNPIPLTISFEVGLGRQAPISYRHRVRPIHHRSTLCMLSTFVVPLRLRMSLTLVRRGPPQDVGLSPRWPIVSPPVRSRNDSDQLTRNHSCACSRGPLTYPPRVTRSSLQDHTVDLLIRSVPRDPSVGNLGFQSSFQIR